MSKGISVVGNVVTTAIIPRIFPLAASSNGRYMQSVTGVPFPIMGRAAWGVLSLSSSDIQTFLNDTVAKGYNAVEMRTLTSPDDDNNPPYSGNGDLPFTKTLGGAAWNGGTAYGNINTDAPDFTTPNENYWTYIDTFFANCETLGLLVLCFPAYVGYIGTHQGWLQEMVANGTTKVQAYGAWIATRYRNRKNLLWMLGGDAGAGIDPFPDTPSTNAEGAFITGLTSITTASTYYTAEWGVPSIASDQTSFGTRCNVNGAYSNNGFTATQALRAYSANLGPGFLLEEPYDEEGPDGNNRNNQATQPCRRFQWWGWINSVGGYCSGNGYVWPFKSGWQSHLNTQTTQDMARLNAFMQSFQWWLLVPDGASGSRTLVTSGAGTIDTLNYVAAAVTSDGATLIAYASPSFASFTVDMTKVRGTATARWYDPSNGSYTAIGSLPNTGTHTFTSPGNNASGFGDWVLRLDA